MGGGTCQKAHLGHCWSSAIGQGAAEACPIFLFTFWRFLFNCKKSFLASKYVHWFKFYYTFCDKALEGKIYHFVIIDCRSMSILGNLWSYHWKPLEDIDKHIVCCLLYRIIYSKFRAQMNDISLKFVLRDFLLNIFRVQLSEIYYQSIHMASIIDGNKLTPAC